MVSPLARVLAGASAGELVALAAEVLARPVPSPVPSLLPPPPGLGGVSRPWLGGPTGIGTSAARPFRPRAAPGAAGDRSGLPLHCPPPVRDDPALGEAVNERLVDWAADCGIYADRLEKLRAANFGRLLMLTHPDTEDPDRLLAAAKCALAEWAVDDYYCDEEDDGADPELAGARLLLANAAVDPAHLPLRYAPRLERGMREDPVLVALRTALEHLARYATPQQVARLKHELAAIFVAFGAEAAWRMAGELPPVWQYLVNRQPNSFLPCIALIDPVGGYQLPAAEYADPRIRRAVTTASLASVLVNDLYSMAKESRSGTLDFNLPTLIAAEDGCSLEEAVRRSVEVHDELVRTFEAEAAALLPAGSPALARYLAGVYAWLGGNHEWHRTSPKYRED
ncbi:family 2 encapsulin nanocompartment cargo protein terpene cyclase [Kitasatospora sp. NPDC051853]|uniref:family 2 encapsulin nanocompartment cargo protein terpene cyclase n=1 Tax=Kitasatospora sp. NPDC051853 TaxID=3364058 RepID=UPI00379356EC